MSFLRLHSHQFLQLAFCGLYLGLVAWQLLGPVPVGLADNGDFPKVLMSLNIAAAPGTQESIAHRYFSPEYVIDPKFHWNSNIPSSEYWFAKAAKRFALWFLPAGRFDLRIMGMLHALVMTGAVWLILRAYDVRLWRLQIAIGALLLFLLSDLAYTQFFSTAYSDAAAIVFFCLFLGIVLNIHRAGSDLHPGWILAFTVIGCAFLTSKLQHQLALLPLSGLAVYYAFRARENRTRLLFIVPVVLFVAVTAGMVHRTKSDYRGDPIYGLIFTRLAADSKQPLQVLNEFGLPASYRKYVGTLPFQPGYLLNQPGEGQFLVNQVPLGKIAGFYARHPDLAIHYLVNDLRQYAPDFNLFDWDIHRLRLSDYPQHKDDTRFIWWSSLRRAVQSGFWGFIPILYLLATVICVVSAVRPQSPASINQWPVLALLVFVGSSTFVVSSLNDCLETARHIILFQVATDFILFLLAAEYAVAAYQRFASRRSAVAEGESAASPGVGGSVFVRQNS